MRSSGLEHGYTMMILLGAGASEAAGIPTTAEMAEEFLSSEVHNPLKTDLKSASQDIETLIRSIHQRKNAFKIYPLVEKKIGQTYDSDDPLEDLDDLENRTGGKEVKSIY